MNTYLKINDDDTKKMQLGIFVSQLIDKGYTTIVAGYEGSGDSGGVEYICASKDDFNTVYESASSWEPYGDDIRDEEGAGSVEDIIDSLTGNIEDWWNNDGGYGVIVIDLKTANYKINNNVRYMHTEEYEHDGKI